jgi:dihydropteroate synthase
MKTLGEAERFPGGSPRYAGAVTIQWRVGPRTLECGPRTLVMGILNVTPDSFSDGGRFFDHERAVEHGLRMVDEGADLLDVGGESTRPGSDPVSVDEELGRVLPVVKRLVAETEVPISIDTRKADVAAPALDEGATIVNDVSAGRDPRMFEITRATDAGIVLMHMLGEPKTMQDEPLYGDVVRDVHEYLGDRIDAADAAGIARDRIAADPGLGFGKTTAHSLQLMRSIDSFLDLGVPILVGPSRKSFIGDALGGVPVDRRREGTAGAVAWMAGRGAHIVRVHDVAPVVEVLAVVDAIRPAG